MGGDVWGIVSQSLMLRVRSLEGLVWLIGFTAWSLG